MNVFVSAVAFLSLGFGGPVSAGPPGVAPPDTAGSPPPAARDQPLSHPTVLENLSSEPGTVEVELTAAPARLSLVKGAATGTEKSAGTEGDTETEVFAYNGTVPGPTLEVREGDRVIVRFRNELPEATTVHWHGVHLPFTADGSPFHPVAPGEEFTYEFTVHEGTAGTYWYHPHPHHRTGYQVGKGLFGAIVVRDPKDPLPELPERLLVLSDNRFGPDGSVDFAEPGTRQARMDEENGREGDVLFVNGQVMPELEIRSGEVQRWRVINASGARVYRLALPGHPFLHVGNDGGLFEEPREVEEILLANSERVELLVRGTGAPGSRVVLTDLPYDRYLPQTRPRDWDEPRELLTVTYSEEPPVEGTGSRLSAGGSADGSTMDSTVGSAQGSRAGRAAGELPETLRSIPALDPAAATEVRQIVLSKNRINGRQMDMERVDQVAKLGATEIWEVENWVGMDHPFHLHGFQFQVLERDGEPEPYRSWKDTVNVPKRSTVRIIVRFDSYPGKWMFHCHILDHEDAGMMGVLEVR